jgi:hypothetical protein
VLRTTIFGERGAWDGKGGSVEKKRRGFGGGLEREVFYTEVSQLMEVEAIMQGSERVVAGASLVSRIAACDCVLAVGRNGRICPGGAGEPGLETMGLFVCLLCFRFHGSVCRRREGAPWHRRLRGYGGTLRYYALPSLFTLIPGNSLKDGPSGTRFRVK